MSNEKAKYYSIVQTNLILIVDLAKYPIGTNFEKIRLICKIYYNLTIG